ncbi:MAG: TIGR01244 family sulfur transferase [Erythrobacter sp.]|jgi:uncharacterized protein (TIGR01244 family)|nr:TIGR01244 family sulfur transferase [Erythrobacter sp.]
MPDFKTLSDTVFASPQIGADDIAAAKAAGVVTIINNRPDGEDPTAPQGATIEALASAEGMAYVAIPIGPAGFGESDIDAMTEALDAADGPVLAYCRSGTRSTLLWALSQAKQGGDPDTIAEAAKAAGYDVSPVRPMMDKLAAR